MAETVRLDLDLEALRLLVQVADLGSISAAARAAQISQPAASKRIKTLEGRLRLELLERRSRGAELTDHGRMVIEWCRAVTDAAEALVTGATALTTQAEATVRIGASYTVGEYMMPRWLTEFRMRGDQPPVQLRVANSHAVIDALRAREIDLGFVESPTVPTDLRSRRIGRDRLVLVVAPDHRLARRRRPLTRRELARLRLITRESGSGAREALERAIGEPMAEPAVELMTNSAVKVAIAAGEFAAALPELVVNQELLDGRLVEVPLVDVDMTRTLRAVWRRGTRWRGATGDFLTLVANKSQWIRSAPGGGYGEGDQAS
jgi:molybdate transport repressor ModE-like protein